MVVYSYKTITGEKNITRKAGELLKERKA